jgi:RNA polymerase sigma-70 factor (ECF subfamily)
LNTAEPNTEQELLRLVAEGHQHAFEKLYHRYKQYIFHSSLSILKSTAAAQDSLQDIFIKIWVNRESLHQMEHFTAWLNTIMRNHLYNKLRQQAQQEKYLAYAMHEKPDTFSEATYNEAELKELTILVADAKKKLSPQQQKVFELSRIQGLKHREIAEAMNISQETVKKYIMDAMKQVRDYLRQHGRQVSVILLLQLLNP